MSVILIKYAVCYFVIQGNGPGDLYRQFFLSCILMKKNYLYKFPGSYPWTMKQDILMTINNLSISTVLFT